MLALFLAVAIIGGSLSGLLSMRGGKNGQWKIWYDQLQKAPWNPPPWVFGPAWTALYALMGWASFLIWEETRASSPALLLYFVQLAVNFAWSPLFFGMRKPQPALFLIGILWVLIVATIVSFHDVSPKAAYLLIPYLLWVSYASTLNAYIVRYNDLDNLLNVI
jgi:benzodiazapine receptor